MKKVKFLRLASVMLMLCLITTCAISGTFAKYTTSGEAGDTARVAKWGVVVKTSGDTLFPVGDGTKVTSTAKVVAPGMTGSLANISLSGTPEVSVAVFLNGTLDLGDNWTTTGSDYYCPITITVAGTIFDGMSYDSANEFEAAVNAKLTELSIATANADTNLSTLNDDFDGKITWAWSFTGGTEQTDAKDTILANKTGTEVPEIVLDLTIRVDQTN